MSPILSRSLASATAALGSAALIVAAGAPLERLVYVDTRLAAPSCTTYESAARTCGRGAATAYKTIAAAAAAAQSGTTVVIRDGNYREPLVPQNSGSAESPIVFKSAANETVVISDVDAPAIQIIARHYITVDGLTVKNVTGWARLQDSTHVVVQHMAFSHSTAPGTTGGFKVVRSSLNRILENRFEDGNDDLLLQDSSNFNMVERNTFTGAAHSLVSIRCANVNTIRGNRFDNAVQKAIEIFDCEAVSDAPFQLDATKRNLIEGNVFLRTRGSVSNYKYNAIQHGGQYTIVRRNVFSNAAGGGVNFQQYASESLFVYGNRLYHNTFYSNRCFAIVGNRGAPKQYYDNRAINNLLYLNRDCAGSGDQVSIDDPAAVVLTANAVESRFVEASTPIQTGSERSAMTGRTSSAQQASHHSIGMKLDSDRRAALRRYRARSWRKRRRDSARGDHRSRPRRARGVGQPDADPRSAVDMANGTGHRPHVLRPRARLRRVRGPGRSVGLETARRCFGVRHRTARGADVPAEMTKRAQVRFDERYAYP